MSRPLVGPTTREVLARVPFLEDAPPHLVARLAARVLERSCARGATLFREGEPSVGFWIVVSGSVNIVKVAPDGRVQILEACGAGDVFALVSAIDEGPYPANVEAREDSRFVLFPTHLVTEAAREHPAIGLGIARHFARRLRRTTCKSASVCLRSVRSRLASYVLEVVARAGREPGGGSVRINLGASQEEVAHRLGTVREVLARTLRGFREENLIAQRGDELTVLDVKGLERVALL